MAYWRANVKLLLVLLTIWFTVSYGFGILLLTGSTRSACSLQAGFLVGPAGVDYVFVILIFVYVALIGRIDRKFGVDDTDTGSDGKESAVTTQMLTYIVVGLTFALT